MKLGDDTHIVICPYCKRDYIISGDDDNNNIIDTLKLNNHIIRPVLFRIITKNDLVYPIAQPRAILSYFMKSTNEKIKTPYISYG